MRNRLYGRKSGALDTEEQLAELQALFAEADACLRSGDHSRVADISNQIAQDFFGWAVLPDDAHRLWRTAAGAVVTVTRDDGKVCKVCMMPWRPGQNDPDEMAFSPALNLHPRVVDWRAWCRDRIDANSDSEPA